MFNQRWEKMDDNSKRYYMPQPIPKETLNKLIKEFMWNYTNNECDLIINGFCKCSYTNKYFNTKLYSFPSIIIDLLMQFIFEERSRSYVDFNKLRKLPKRIYKEIQRLEKDSPPGIHIFVHPNNYRYFLVEIIGPGYTPYEGGTFLMELFLTKQYPMKPPKVRMLTTIYHPSIDILGRICLDVLKDKWTPALTISRACLSIQLLMQDPNPDDPLNGSYSGPKINSQELHKTAREWAKKYAM